MLLPESEDYKIFTFAEAREYWLQTSQKIDRNGCIDLICDLIKLHPDRPFFFAHAFNLARATEDELRIARLIISIGKKKATVQLQPVFTASDIIQASPHASVREKKEAIKLRDKLLAVSPHQHYFRAQLARREKDLKNAFHEISMHLQLFPTDVPALILRASIAMQTGQWGLYCKEILALSQITGNARSSEMLSLFQSFREAQGLILATPEEIIEKHELLQTPGAVYECAINKAPPHNTAGRTGVVLLTGSLSGGGAERIVATMVGQFRKMEPDEDLQLWLFSKTDGVAGKSLFYLPLTGLSEKELHIVEPVEKPDEPFCWLPPFYAQRAQAIYNELIKIKPRVLYITLDEAIVAGGIAAVMAGVPKIVLHCHNMSPPNLHGHDRLSFGWDRAFRTLLKRENVKFINVAQVAVDDYLNWCKVSLEECKAEVIHNGVDFEPIDEGLALDYPKIVRAELGIPIDSPIVGTAIRFTDVKQPLIWLEAAKIIRQAQPNTHFIIYGDGILLAPCISKIKKLGLEGCVHLPGRVSDLGHRIGVFDILMLSSRSEGFPNVLIEAQAAGAIPVSFDVGGCRETMDPGRSGIVVSGHTAAALAAEVIILLNKPKKIERMKNRALKFVRKTFSVDQMVTELHDIVYGMQVPKIKIRKTTSQTELKN